MRIPPRNNCQGARRRLRREAVADLAHGVDEDRVGRVGLDLVAERGNEAVDAAAGYDAVVAPDGVEDFVARQGAPCFYKKAFDLLRDIVSMSNY